MKKKSKLLNKLITAMFAVLCVALLCVPVFASAPVEGELVEILPETTLTAIEDVPGTALITQNVPVLQVGMTYMVNFNGTVYSSTAIDGQEMGAPAGIVFAINEGADLTIGEGIVFVLTYDPSEGLVVNWATDDTSVTISIYQVVESPSGALFSDISSLVDSSIGWICQFVNTIVTQPLLLCFCIVIFVGLGIGLIARIKK